VKKKELSKKIVVKKRFVAKHLSETFAKIQMGEEREIIVTWSRASTIIPSMVGHTIIMGFYPVRFLTKMQNSYIFLYKKGVVWNNLKDRSHKKSKLSGESWKNISFFIP
jgi:hypothetical protein